MLEITPKLLAAATDLAEALQALLAEADAYANLMPRWEEGSPSGKAEAALRKAGLLPEKE